jgi:hypothetical protein
VPAELVAHRGQELVPEGGFLAGPETVLQGHRDDREGDPRKDTAGSTLKAEIVLKGGK